MNKIDKGIPMPNAAYGSKYSFDQMDVGDSQFFDGWKSTTKCNPYTCALVWGSRHNAKFTGRKEGTGVRVWRVA